MGRLYCIPDISRLEEYAAFSEKYNAAFEYNDFFIPAVLDDDVVKGRIINTYVKTGRDMSNDTMHGAFLDICINSSDPKIFQISDLRVRQCMDIAEKMGLKAVIFHTNYIVNFRLKSYLNSWIYLNEKYWNKILLDYPNQNIYIENMFDESPYMIGELAERMSGHSRFGICLDVAHAHISGSDVKMWYDVLDSYVKHLHLNDNDGNEDLHAPVGSGTFEWGAFNKWSRKLETEPSVLIEVRNYEHLMQSVEYMQKDGIYPFNGGNI